jgi:hypothetical protein
MKATVVDERNPSLSAGGAHRGVPTGTDTVRVLAAGMRRWSECTCGWRGSRRVMRSRNVLDALIHAARCGCQPAVPLVERRFPCGSASLQGGQP